MGQHDIPAIVVFFLTMLSIPNCFFLYLLWRHVRVTGDIDDLREDLQDKQLKLVEMICVFGFTYKEAQIKEFKTLCTDLKDGELLVHIGSSSPFDRDIVLRLNFTNLTFTDNRSLNLQCAYLKEYLLYVEMLEKRELGKWGTVNIKGLTMGNVWMDVRKNTPNHLPL